MYRHSRKYGAGHICSWAEIIKEQLVQTDANSHACQSWPHVCSIGFRWTTRKWSCIWYQQPVVFTVQLLPALHRDAYPSKSMSDNYVYLLLKALSEHEALICHCCAPFDWTIRQRSMKTASCKSNSVKPWDWRDTRWQMWMDSMWQVIQVALRQGRSKGVIHKEPSRAYSEIRSSCHQAWMSPTQMHS